MTPGRELGPRVDLRAGEPRSGRVSQEARAPPPPVHLPVPCPAVRVRARPRAVRMSAPAGPARRIRLPRLGPCRALGGRAVFRKGRLLLPRAAARAQGAALVAPGLSARVSPTARACASARLRAPRASRAPRLCPPRPGPPPTPHALPPGPVRPLLPAASLAPPAPSVSRPLVSRAAPFHPERRTPLFDSIKGEFKTGVRC